MFLIDTNIFLELALIKRKRKTARRFSPRVFDGTVEAIVTHFTVHAVETSIGKGNKSHGNLAKYREFARSARFRRQYFRGSINCRSGRKSGKVNSEDAVQYFVAKKSDSSAIVSF